MPAPSRTEPFTIDTAKPDLAPNKTVPAGPDALRSESPKLARMKAQKAETANVHLFTWALDVAASEVRRHRAALTDAERSRADRFLNPRAATRFVVARGTMREILSGYVGCRPDELRLRSGRHGKPYLAEAGVGGPVHFNLSHSHGMATLGVSADCPIGVDLESVRAVDEGLPEQVFAQEERDALNDLAGEERQLGFFNGWTRKEAVIKADGRGLSLPLDSFAVSLGPSDPVRLLWSRDRSLGQASWSLAAFDPAPGFVGAVAAPVRDCRLVMTRWAA